VSIKGIAQAAKADKPDVKGCDLQRSNSLIDLAARIQQEHEACRSCLQRGLEHAIAAGRLLIEAKTQVPHGQWLSWLKTNCVVSPRTAQAYMRVTNSIGDDEAKAQRVAHLSLRDALDQLGEVAVYGRALKAVERQDTRASYSLETPQALLPTTGRKVGVAHHRETRQWMLAIGPTISRAALLEKQAAAAADEAVKQLQAQHDQVLQRAAELEAAAKSLRDDAKSIHADIARETANKIGPVIPFTETITFQTSKAVDRKLAALPNKKRIDRLLAARRKADKDLKEVERGFWGDMSLLSSGAFASSGPSGTGWTKVGSPDWLSQIFGDIEPTDQKTKSARASDLARADSDSRRRKQPVG
jgi:hypothetical protein